MKSTLTMAWTRDMLNREMREEFGEEGMGADLQWVAENMHTVRSLQKGSFLHPCEIFCPELIRLGQGKKVLQDVYPTKFDVADLEFIRFRYRGQSPVKWSEISKKAALRNANFGLSDGKRLIVEQDKISVNLKAGAHILLTGTILVAPPILHGPPSLVGRDRFYMGCLYMDPAGKLKIGFEDIRDLDRFSWVLPHLKDTL